MTLHSYYALIEVHQCEIAVDGAAVILASINFGRILVSFPSLSLN